MAILQSTLDLLRGRLDAAFQISDPRSEEWVALTNPVDLDGRVSESARNKIVTSSQQVPGLSAQADSVRRAPANAVAWAGTQVSTASPMPSANQSRYTGNHSNA